MVGISPRSQVKVIQCPHNYITSILFNISEGLCVFLHSGIRIGCGLGSSLWFKVPDGPLSLYRHSVFLSHTLTDTYTHTNTKVGTWVALGHCIPVCAGGHWELITAAQNGLGMSDDANTHIHTRTNTHTNTHITILHTQDRVRQFNQSNWNQKSTQ